MRRLPFALVLLVACGSPGGSGTPPRPVVHDASSLTFVKREGRTENHVLRAGRVAAHVLTTSGDAPRIVFAFPAGNMGIGLWLEGAADLAVESQPQPVERGAMRGVEAALRLRAPRVRVKRALLASIRVLRDYGHDGRVPEGLGPEVLAGPPLVLRRTTLDGAHHLELDIAPRRGEAISADAFVASAGGEISLQMTALSDEPPLTPILEPRILTGAAGADVSAREALTFLTYEEKICAGSWQYLTYFGRDTLLSTRLLMPVLQPAAVEAALGSVIDRLDEAGDVAHEEDVGEWAVMENLKEEPRPADLRKPRYDYKMVDDDFLLAPVLSAYVEREEARPRLAAFFARRTSGGKTFAEAVRTNLDRVVRLAAPFAEKAAPTALVRIRDGLSVGNWRDSNEGLGNGKYPYDVNAALVPAALRAAEKLYALEPIGRDARAAGRAGELARAWSRAEPLFQVRIEPGDAKKRVAAYAAEQRVDAREALASIDGPITFPGVSLDDEGAPVPIENTDDGFLMMFGEPSSEWLIGAAKRIERPFPAGLRTPVGVVVANPAYATDAALRAIFTRDHYHGTVVWSWQQALLLAGIRAQRARADLSEGARAALASAESALGRVIEATHAMRTSELWSWAVDAGGWHVVPFGQGEGHHTEANALQLWSTVYLALDKR
jgi:hypothetical protein